MEKYVSVHDTIIDMHERGYSQDFKLSGNDLLWLQEKIFVRAGEFSIIEFHTFHVPYTQDAGSIIYGILALYYDVKGILIYNTGHPVPASPVLIKKLNELSLRAAIKPLINYRKINLEKNVS